MIYGDNLRENEYFKERYPTQ